MSEGYHHHPPRQAPLNGGDHLDERIAQQDERIPRQFPGTELLASSPAVATSGAPDSLAVSISPAQDIDVIEEGRNVIRTFLQEHTCYELIKNSGKVVVFDVKIPINLAFFALVEHDIRSAPLWDADLGKFVGMITATDYAHILCHFHSKSLSLSEMAQCSIASWKISFPSPEDGVVIAKPDDSLYHVCTVLREQRLHRLPLLDPLGMSALAIITHGGILEFLVATFREQRRLFDLRFRDLGIGTYENVLTAPASMPLFGVLQILLNHRVSAVPIVDSNGSCVGVYGMSDVTNLAREQAIAQLDMPIIDVLQAQATEGIYSEGLHLCTVMDTLHVMFEKFAAAKAHRLICVDGHNRCIGIVSLSDVFSYFLD